MRVPDRPGLGFSSERAGAALDQESAEFGKRP